MSHQVHEDDMPDLTGKIAIVTGANSGIGLQTAAVLASKGAKVYMGVRSEAKYNRAVREIWALYPATANSSLLKFLEIDLSSCQKAKCAADKFRSMEKTLHLLYNTAGVMGTPRGKLSADGYEYQWAVNLFGPFVFTYHLLPILLFTSSQSPKDSVRIINTSSSGASQASTQGIPLQDPTVGSSTSSPYRCYGHSKAGIILVTRQLAKRYPTIISLAPHPGPTRSNLTREMQFPKAVMWFLNHTVFKSVQIGALTQLYAGTSSEITAAESGSYMVPLGKIQPKLPRSQCYDDGFGERVWEWCIDAMSRAKCD